MTLEELKAGKVFLIDKPIEWTSFQAVNKLKWAILKYYKIKKIKIGHAGTLDPKATGLLIVCAGKQTKEISKYQGQIKEYRGIIKLGATTPSYDTEEEESKFAPITHLTKELILKTTEQFIGDINQKPPLFSAIKKKGKRLYEHARKGEVVEIKSRRIYIESFQITKIELPFVEFKVVCGKGTYIRSLAYDFGKALETVAYLTTLRRTKIGDFSVENAKHPFEWKNEYFPLTPKEENSSE